MKLYNCSVIDKRDFTKFKREKDFGSNYILAWPLRAVSILDKTSFHKISGGLKAARIMLNENCSITVNFLQVAGSHCCWLVCHISKGRDNFNYQSRTFESSPDHTMAHVIEYWSNTHYTTFLRRTIGPQQPSKLWKFKRSCGIFDHMSHIICCGNLLLPGLEIMESQKRINPVIMDIHNWIMNIHNWTMNIHNC